MKFFLLLLFGACCVLTNAAEKTLPSPARYESFESGVPKTWRLQGKGKLLTNPWHYKFGKKSLQWDFAAGDEIRINNSIGNTKRRGGPNNSCLASFGVWIYVLKAMPGKNLRFEFCVGKTINAYFDFPLNFTGWQCAFPNYQRDLAFGCRQVSADVNNLVIKAPDCDGTVLIDLLVYNGLMYRGNNCVPRKKPWRAPEFDKRKYPRPQKVSGADARAIERIKSELLPKIVISKTDKSNTYWQQAINNIKRLNIIEDEHGIRGVPMQLPRAHSSDFGTLFFTENGIPKDKLGWFNNTILKGYSGQKHPNGIFNRMLAALKMGITREQYKILCDNNVMLWKYIINQGYNCSHGTCYYYASWVVMVAQAIYVTRDSLFKNNLMKELFNYTQFAYYPLFEIKKIANMDYFYGFNLFYCLAFLYSNDPLEQVQVLRFLADKLGREMVEEQTFMFGFKPDGTGNHHGFKRDYMESGLYMSSKIARVVAGSSFALPDEAFKILKRVALREYFYGNNLQFPIFLQGTGVFDHRPYRSNVEDSLLPESIRNLALARKDGIDRELAQAYVNLKPAIKNLKHKRFPYDNCFEKNYNIQATALPSGNISMPYGYLMAQRRADWVAVVSGNSIDMRTRGNHYMYHGGNAPLSILGKEGFYSSGNAKEGWDWNRTSGTTCLYIPNLIDIKFSPAKPTKKQQEELSEINKWYQKYHKARDRTYLKCAGGISWRNKNGCFSKVFAGDKLFNIFRGIKTYFFINDKIYALGSNIYSRNKKYRVQTNLYQKVLKAENTPTYVDGEKINSFPVVNKMLDEKKSHYLIDPVGNGYYIPKGQRLFVARKNQKSRWMEYSKRIDSSGNFATAWIDHGISTSTAKYEYVVMPYCGEDAIALFTKKARDGRAYKILQQDGKAHIIHDLIDDFYGAIFFSGGKVRNLPHVAYIERACQIMYQKNNNTLEVSAGDIDLHINEAGRFTERVSLMKPLKIIFSGKWRLKKTVAGIKIVSSDNKKTVLKISCIHGKSFNFDLIKQ